MIKNKEDYKYYLKRDALALRKINQKRPRIVGDRIWKFQRALRKCEYHRTFSKTKKMLLAPLILFHKIKFKKLSEHTSFTIKLGTFGEGLSIAHRGTIVVSHCARIGKNCRIHEGVTIGGANGIDDAAVIGDNVFIGPGVKIIGALTIADNVAIAANAVVTISIEEPGTTWGGIPARKISDNDSIANLSPYLFE